MTITFKPLWKLLIDREMTKEDLRMATGLSAVTIASMGKDGNVTTDGTTKNLFSPWLRCSGHHDYHFAH